MNSQIVSKLGFGCGRIVGGASIKQSSAILTSAYDLGIRHFDVAPSYGLGTAEDALGQVFEGEKLVKIATKVGIARPTGASGLAILRKYLGPAIKSSKLLTSMAMKSLSNNVVRGLFDEQFVKNSFEDSLKRLRRDTVDYLLLHEPKEENLTVELNSFLEKLLQQNTVKEIGMGFNSIKPDNIPTLGTVLQSRIGSLELAVESEYNARIVHGVFRYGLNTLPRILNNNPIKKILQRLKVDIHNTDNLPAICLALAAGNKSNHLVLISYSNIRRMNETLKLADEIYLDLNLEKVNDI